MIRIICAAIWYKDQPTAPFQPKNITSGIVLCGFNHAAIIQQHVSIADKAQFEMGEHEQGFLTNDNRFVDRKEGLQIAIAASQLKELDHQITSLYSEYTNY